MIYFQPQLFYMHLLIDMLIKYLYQQLLYISRYFRLYQSKPFNFFFFFRIIYTFVFRTKSRRRRDFRKGKASKNKGVERRTEGGPKSRPLKRYKQRNKRSWIDAINRGLQRVYQPYSDVAPPLQGIGRSPHRVGPPTQ